MEVCFVLVIICVVILAILGITYGFLAATMAIQRIWQRHYHILTKKKQPKPSIRCSNNWYNPSHSSDAATTVTGQRIIDRRSGTFTIEVLYADISELQSPAKISTYTIGPFQSKTSERAKLKVKVRLNLHGIVSVELATLLEEEDVEVPVTKVSAKEANKMDMDAAPAEAVPSTAIKTGINMQDAKGATDVPGSENCAGASWFIMSTLQCEIL